jgi:hypothetical protein
MIDIRRRPSSGPLGHLLPANGGKKGHTELCDYSLLPVPSLGEGGAKRRVRGRAKVAKESTSNHKALPN